MTHPLTPREKVADDLLFFKLKDLITEQSEGEWDDAMIARDALHFANHLRPLFDRCTALASGSGDHAELARLAEAATPGPWKGRQPAYSEGAAYIESELPCINGLSAWFSVAIVPAPSPEELGYSDGAIDSDANAAFIAAANPATVLALLAEIAALRAEHVHLVEQKEGAEDALFNALSRATEAERKLAEAVGLLTRWLNTRGEMSGAGTVETATSTFLSKEAERG